MMSKLVCWLQHQSYKVTLHDMYISDNDDFFGQFLHVERISAPNH